MLQGQSKTIAEMLVKALSERNTISINEYSVRLANIRDRIEELLWVLNKKDAPSNHLLLEVYTINVPGKKEVSLTMAQIFEKLKIGELTMNDLQADVSDKVRKAALHSKKFNHT
jgi:Icc-related predicted phosphoesterase